jgi:hypothetical protein
MNVDFQQYKTFFKRSCTKGEKANQQSGQWRQPNKHNFNMLCQVFRNACSAEDMNGVSGNREPPENLIEVAEHGFVVSDLFLWLQHFIEFVKPAVEKQGTVLWEELIGYFSFTTI